MQEMDPQDQPQDQQYPIQPKLAYKLRSLAKREEWSGLIELVGILKEDALNRLVAKRLGDVGATALAASRLQGELFQLETIRSLGQIADMVIERYEQDLKASLEQS